MKKVAEKANLWGGQIKTNNVQPAQPAAPSTPVVQPPKDKDVSELPVGQKAVKWGGRLQHLGQNQPLKDDKSALPIAEKMKLFGGRIKRKEKDPSEASVLSKASKFGGSIVKKPQHPAPKQ